MKDKKFYNDAEGRAYKEGYEQGKKDAEQGYKLLFLKQEKDWYSILRKDAKQKQIEVLEKVLKMIWQTGSKGHIENINAKLEQELKKLKVSE